MKHHIISSPPFSVGPLVIQNRIYSRVAGSVFDIPQCDRDTCLANGFTEIYQTGTTSERPAVFPSMEFSPQPGALYYDTSISTLIAWDGQSWRNAATGAVV